MHLHEFAELSLPQALTVSGICLLAYTVALAVYRLYLSPLSKYPGPKLAALTLWYEFYFDVIKRGKFAWEIKRMHEVYGPVVRINPFELHVNDPDFYDELYTGGKRKRDKHPWSADMFCIPGAMISSVSHDVHRQRRAPLAPYFSHQAIRRFDPVVRSKLDILCQRFSEFEKSGELVRLDAAFAAFTTDIITQYAFGISYDHLNVPDFNPAWPALIIGSGEASLLHKQIPWITPIMRKIPVPILLKIKPDMGYFVELQNGLNKKIAEISQGDHTHSPEDQQATIFHGLLSADQPDSEKTPARLLGEGQTLVAAGTVTTAHYLTTVMFHLLDNPPVLQKLKAELEDAVPNAAILPAYQDLDRLTYLNAVINEGFRISHGVIARLTRVAPDEELTVASYTIPPGTPIGMSSWLVHLNPDLFPNPTTFNPERWLEPGADRLKKYLVNFTKGSRMCLGKDLARTEIVYTLVRLVRGFEMELWETERSDVDIEHDVFNPMTRLGSKGCRVVFTKA